jgi:uncharacterized phage-associated protein
MLTAHDVAHFFIWKSSQCEGGSAVSNLKLQKLLYYAKGFYQALYDTPLFPEALQAWRHGPVVPGVYHSFKNCGGNPIGANAFDPSKFTEDQLSFLEEVWEIYGQFSAWKLRELSHCDKPWLDHEADASYISDAELGSFFRGRLANA